MCVLSTKKKRFFFETGLNIIAREKSKKMNVVQACMILGVDPREYTAETVDRAFRRAALLCHPDKGGSEAAFVRLTTAVGVLKRNVRSPVDDLSSLLERMCGMTEAASARACDLFAVVNVRNFCEWVGEAQKQRNVRLAIERAGGVTVRCNVTNHVVARGLGLSASAVRFFRHVVTYMEQHPDVECILRRDGVDVFSISTETFAHFTCDDIAFNFCV